MSINSLNDIKNNHPTWYKYIKRWEDVYPTTLPNLDITPTFSRYLKYKNVLRTKVTPEIVESLIKQRLERASGMDLYFDISPIEVFNDIVEEEIHNHKKDSFIKSLKTESYKHLFSNEIENEIKIILDNKITPETLKNMFFKKIARYRNHDELLIDLINFKYKCLGWNEEFYINKIKEKNLNAKILEKQGDYFIIEVFDYESCKELAPSAWCITQSEMYFDMYKKSINRQLIALNFSMKIENNESIIGLTASFDGEIQASYLKNDHETPQEKIKEFKFKALSDESVSELITENRLVNFALINRVNLVKKEIEDQDSLEIYNLLEATKESLRFKCHETRDFLIDKLKELEIFVCINQMLKRVSDELGFGWEIEDKKLLKEVVIKMEIINNNMLKNKNFCECITTPEDILSEQQITIYEETMGL